MYIKLRLKVRIMPQTLYSLEKRAIFTIKKIFSQKKDDSKIVNAFKQVHYAVEQAINSREFELARILCEWGDKIFFNELNINLFNEYRLFIDDKQQALRQKKAKDTDELPVLIATGGGIAFYFNEIIQIFKQFFENLRRLFSKTYKVQPSKRNIEQNFLKFVKFYGTKAGERRPDILNCSCNEDKIVSKFENIIEKLPEFGRKEPDFQLLDWCLKCLNFLHPINNKRGEDKLVFQIKYWHNKLQVIERFIAILAVDAYIQRDDDDTQKLYCLRLQEVAIKFKLQQFFHKNPEHVLEKSIGDFKEEKLNDLHNDLAFFEKMEIKDKEEPKDSKTCCTP